MNLNSLSVLLGVAAGMTTILLLLTFRTRRMLGKLNAQARATKSAAEHRLENGEAAASAVAEQIEEMANRELSAHPDVRVDFGTAPDGSLEIRVGSECYASVEEIADPRVREAVERAVAEFNR